MRIRRKFLKLTKWTYPNGTEKFLEWALPSGYKEDGLGNYYLQIGESTTMFTCHLDTACMNREKIKHSFTDKYVHTDGKTILGADDKAGMVVILNMIEKKVPGLYYFFIGEEVGCIGSGLLANNWDKSPFSQTIKKVVSFDRRGTKSVISHQFYGRCCSDNFAEELSFRLNITDCGLSMEPDDTGIMTDSAKFMDLVPECTNISVGYYKEHTFNECQDLDFLTRLCRAVCLVDWETLPIERLPMEVEDDCDFEDDDDFESYYQGLKTKYCGEETDEFTTENWTHVKMGNVVERRFISKYQIQKEKSLIYNWVFTQDVYSSSTGIIWNGNSLYVELRGSYEFVGERTDVMCFIPELKTIPISQLSKLTSRKIKEKSFEVKTKKEFLL